MYSVHSKRVGERLNKLNETWCLQEIVLIYIAWILTTFYISLHEQCYTHSRRTSLIRDNLFLSRPSKVKSHDRRTIKRKGTNPTTRTVIEFDTVYGPLRVPTTEQVHKLNLELPRRCLSPKTILSLPLSLKYWWDALEQEERIAPTTPTISESAASCWAAILQLVEGFVPPSLIMPTKDCPWSS